MGSLVPHMYRRKRQMLIGNWKPLCGIDPMLVLEFSMLVLESCPTQTIDLFLSGANISFRNAVAMSIDPEWNMIQPDIGRIEKWILRNAFDDDAKPYLPKHILYRQKEQFNDGVGYSWIDRLKDHANQQVTNSMLANVAFVYPENTPTTKEAYYYWTIFEKFFPKKVFYSYFTRKQPLPLLSGVEIHTDSEELLIIKTRESLLNALTNHVKANHEYNFDEEVAVKESFGCLLLVLHRYLQLVCGLLVLIFDVEMYGFAGGQCTRG